MLMYATVRCGADLAVCHLLFIGVHASLPATPGLYLGTTRGSDQTKDAQQSKDKETPEIQERVSEWQKVHLVGRPQLVGVCRGLTLPLVAIRPLLQWHRKQFSGVPTQAAIQQAVKARRLFDRFNKTSKFPQPSWHAHTCNNTTRHLSHAGRYQPQHSSCNTATGPACRAKWE